MDNNYKALVKLVFSLAEIVADTHPEAETIFDLLSDFEIELGGDLDLEHTDWPATGGE